MSLRRRNLLLSFLPLFAIILLASCGGGGSTTPPPPGPKTFQVTITGVTSGTGTVVSAPAGINCPATCTATFAQGTAVTLTATPAAGYTFASWGGSCSGAATPCSITVNAAVSVSATFNANPIALTVAVSGPGMVTSNPAGITCPGTCTANFPQNSSVTLTETASAGNSFNSWSGDCTGSTSTCVVTLAAARSVTASFGPITAVHVSLSGAGSGAVVSTPAGINCPTTCTASFSTGSSITLTATAAGQDAFSKWNGGCTGPTNTCTVTADPNALPVNAVFGKTLQSAINHIVFLAQENRGFEHYFGAMRGYWAQSGGKFPDQPFNGLPQFNPVPGPVPTNKGCDPAFPWDPNAMPPQTNDCTIDSNSPLIPSFHPSTQCLENPSPSWAPSHVDMNYYNDTMFPNVPISNAPMDGFVWTSGHDARSNNFFDTGGVRAMAYYDWTDLPYYYFMASSFATSDNWFSPAMSRTQPNRMYSLAATSAGHAYPLPQGGQVLANPTIFDLLEPPNKVVTWKAYVTDMDHGINNVQDSSLNMFATAGKYPNNIVASGQFLTDLNNPQCGLPSVSYIEPGLVSGLDEHPGIDDGNPGTSIQDGAKYVSTLINTLMKSSCWKDTVFILTFDEFGGFYDHVPPIARAYPDPGPIVVPTDLNQTGDVCVPPNSVGPTCYFKFSGYRVPLIVVSPFTRANYVSHTPTDYTAWLKLVETRFGVSNLTARDAAAIDMTEFFDFVNEPWKTPPTPPNQPQGEPCVVNPPPYP